MMLCVCGHEPLHHDPTPTDTSPRGYCKECPCGVFVAADGTVKLVVGYETLVNGEVVCLGCATKFDGRLIFDLPPRQRVCSRCSRSMILMANWFHRNARDITTRCLECRTELTEDDNGLICKGCLAADEQRDRHHDYHEAAGTPSNLRGSKWLTP